MARGILNILFLFRPPNLLFIMAKIRKHPVHESQLSKVT
jgi:hypothetical protein